MLMDPLPVPYSGSDSTTHVETVPLRSVATLGPYGNTLSEIRLAHPKGPQGWAVHRPQQSGTSLSINKVTIWGLDKGKDPYRSER